MEYMDSAKDKNPNSYYRAQFTLLRAICKDDGTASLMDAISTKRTFIKLMKNALSIARDRENKDCEGESVWMEIMIFIAERVCFCLGGRDHNEPTRFMKEGVKNQLRKKAMKELGWFLLDTHEKMFEIAMDLMPNDAARKEVSLAQKMPLRMPDVISNALPFSQGLPDIIVSQPKLDSQPSDQIRNMTPPQDPASLSPMSAQTGSAHRQTTPPEPPGWSIPRTPSFASQRYGQPQPWLDFQNSYGHFYSVAFTQTEITRYRPAQGEMAKDNDDDDPFAFIKKGPGEDSQDPKQTSHPSSMHRLRIPSSFTKKGSILQENKDFDPPTVLKKENVQLSNKVSYPSQNSQPQNPSSSTESYNATRSKSSRRAASPGRSSTNCRRINHGSHSELEIEAVLRSQIQEVTRSKRQRTPTPPGANGSRPTHKRSRSDELITPPLSRETSSETGSIGRVVRLLGENIGGIILGDGAADEKEDRATNKESKKIENGDFAKRKFENRPTDQKKGFEEEEDDYRF